MEFCGFVGIENFGRRGPYLLNYKKGLASSGKLFYEPHSQILSNGISYGLLLRYSCFSTLMVTSVAHKC